MVDVPTVYFGKTQSGKTYRAFESFQLHEGPAVFVDIQWRRYNPGTAIVTDADQVIGQLQSWGNGPPPKIVWNPDDYGELETLVDYVLAVHKDYHLRYKRPPPPLAIYLDEVSLAVQRGQNDTLPAVRLFTQGYQHNVIGVAISQWVAQIHQMIVINSVDFYIFALNEKDYYLLEQNYKIEVPDQTFAPWKSYAYWRYNGEWFKGYPDGTEMLQAAPTEEPKDEDKTDDAGTGDGLETEQTESAYGSGESGVGSGQSGASPSDSESDSGRTPEGYKRIR